MTVRQNLIGLLEDDPDQAALFRLWLESHGYATRLYPQAGEFRRKLGAESVDLLLLDWNLPDESGIEVLRALRASGVRLPVIFLTARNEEEDIVAGLRAGADDYLTKPPKQGELLARVGALLRRVGFQGEQAEDEDAQPYRIEVPKRRVSLNGREILLTEREFDLALFLFRRRVAW
jgi:DNA-binding response OmpR family regulator